MQNANKNNDNLFIGNSLPVRMLEKYTQNTNKNVKVYFIIGADNLIKFHKWKNWHKIPKFAKIVVFHRKSYSIKSLNSIVRKKLKKNDLIYVNSKSINISSTSIRKFGKIDTNA